MPWLIGRDGSMAVGSSCWNGLAWRSCWSPKMSGLTGRIEGRLTGDNRRRYASPSQFATPIAQITRGKWMMHGNTSAFSSPPSRTSHSSCVNRSTLTAGESCFPNSFPSSFRLRGLRLPNRSPHLFAGAARKRTGRFLRDRDAHGDLGDCGAAAPRRRRGASRTEELIL
jgi:hypothetical protein